MATGYTHDVKDGKVRDFRTFALRCARGMGACIMQRDDPMNEPPKQEVLTDHYSKRLAELRAEMEVVRAWTDEEAAAASAADHTGQVVAHERRVAAQVTTLSNYRAMEAQVQAWTPPTTEHQGLKDFMLEQLSESIKWDCHEVTPPESALSGEAFKRVSIDICLRNLLDTEVYQAREVAAVTSHSQWIADLYAALPAAENG